MSVPPPSENPETAGVGERQRSILLVDDERVLLDGLERALALADMEVVACSNFEDAHRHLRSRSFDVLITDVRLGAFNGLQLAGLARDLYPDMKIVVFSGFDDVVLRQEADRLDALYVVKPVTAQQLLQMIG
jgi:two-component system response regulator YesN